jgi:hypothetical protein
VDYRDTRALAGLAGTCLSFAGLTGGWLKQYKIPKIEES